MTPVRATRTREELLGIATRAAALVGVRIPPGASYDELETALHEIRNLDLNSCDGCDGRHKTRFVVNLDAWLCDRCYRKTITP